MKKYEKNIREVLGVLQGATLINTFLSSAVVFLILYIFFFLVNLFPVILASLLSIIYLIKEWIKKSGVYTERLVEKKFPFLKNKLTTAKDTLHNENYVIGRLREEVALKLKRVDASQLFNKNVMIFKLILVLVLTFSLLFVTAINFRLVDTQSLLFGIEFKRDNLTNSSFMITEEGNLNIVDIATYEDSNQDDYTDFLNVKAVGAKEYKDPITEDERELVKNYFNRIQGETDGL